jgi:ferredoxin
MNLVVFIIFVALVGGEWISRRFWCRNLCPLGALLGVISKVSPFRRRVSATCRDCGRCRHECKMAAIPAEPRQTLNPECIECYSCVAVCPAKAVAIAPGRAADQQAPGLDLSRRRLLGAAGIGLAWAGIAHTGASAKFVLSPRGGEIRGTTRHLIRPPGALPEDEFLARCIRCGECMKVCPMNALQPALSEGGIEGFWSPVVVPRIGYCMQPCNLCGAVCPTGAIQRFEIEDKPNTFIGTATINRNTCLAWYAEKTCLVCNEACSYQAIPIQVIDGFKRPLIDETKCVGCGECENKCPIQPDAAITVSSLGERRQRMLEPGGH